MFVCLFYYYTYCIILLINWNLFFENISKLLIVLVRIWKKLWNCHLSIFVKTKVEKLQIVDEIKLTFYSTGTVGIRSVWAFTVHQMQMHAMCHKKYNSNLSFMLTYLYTLYSRLADQETVLFNKTYRSVQKGC